MEIFTWRSKICSYNTALTTLPVFLKHSLLVLDTYKAAVHVYRGLSADGV